jgi:outer membrane protein OmpA-like peptidoglycan-associated protein
MTEPTPTVPWLAGLGGAAAGFLALVIMLLTVRVSVANAGDRLKRPDLDKPKVAVADNSEVAYCTPRFKEVLQRVLHSCGLADTGTRRGCKPTDVKTFASISDEDFNELFTPLKGRGGVIQFDNGKSDLDEEGKKLLDDRWLDRKGARYFFIVARGSRTGTQARNRQISHERANSVMFQIKAVAKDDPDLDKKVGMLWLGNEYAQLSADYCTWSISRSGKKCDDEAINRSAFVSWVDCRL